MKLTQADIWFSRCIRERANWRCEYPGCGCISEEGRSSGGDRYMQCSHFLSRKYKITRYHSDNALCLCAMHHELVENNPFLHNKIFVKICGKGVAERLTELKNDALYKPEGGFKVFEKEASKHYKNQYKEMRDKRLKGETGRIEFIGFQ